MQTSTDISKQRPAVRTMIHIPISKGGHQATLVTFDGLSDDNDHFAVLLGQWSSANALFRIHSECVTGDVFGSLRCDCGPQLDESIELVAASGGGILYLRQEGRGIGLKAKIDSYRLQNSGMDTYEANIALGYGRDMRDYKVAAEMFQALNLSSLRLLTNNGKKTEGLRRYGIEVREQVPTGQFKNPHNEAYISAKRSSEAHAI